MPRKVIKLPGLKKNPVIEEIGKGMPRIPTYEQEEVVEPQREVNQPLVEQDIDTEQEEGEIQEEEEEERDVKVQESVKLKNNDRVSSERVALIFLGSKVEEIGTNLQILNSVLHRMNKDYNEIVQAFSQQTKQEGE